eukprot:CAMPEP_0113458208 /NCGR_PEP_ID=MMETSP0014_2-20120614/9804_1 /TAXON_ID=2857 /ORGANISM="Nitzschia sp." /LENGTH=117 /DNA_ID=CAMNT_0000349725 /DNA_START=90 /DNA_END=443 /DNA_ORIENTATION=+ /assembly_acc=CAM_ASM_000159
MSEVAEPKSKKAKLNKLEDTDEEEFVDDQEQDDSDEDDAPKAQKNKQGEAFFELSKTRRCTVREYKGKVLVDFREFYEKDGDMLPGKKGISLNKDQYEMLSKLFKSGALEKEVAKLT